MSILNISQFCIGLGLGFSATFVPFVTEKGFGDDEDDIPSSSQIGIIGWFPKNSQNHQQVASIFSPLVSVMSIGQIVGALLAGASGSALGRR